MAEADKVEEDEDLRKKLWLLIAKYVVEQGKGTKRENIRQAIAFLKETDGLLKIEDMLPLFPDFPLIDDFKLQLIFPLVFSSALINFRLRLLSDQYIQCVQEAICSSLVDYNKQIEQLKHEMNVATHDADNIRNDMNTLAQRYSIIDQDEECGVCQRKFLTAGREYGTARGFTSVGPMPPFYIFPCGHNFHAQCLIAHVTCTDEAHIRSQLDDAIASECPFCSERMIKEISLPFIVPEESQHAASWEMKQNVLVASQRSMPLPVYLR